MISAFWSLALLWALHGHTLAPGVLSLGRAKCHGHYVPTVEEGQVCALTEAHSMAWTSEIARLNCTPESDGPVRSTEISAVGHTLLRLQFRCGGMAHRSSRLANFSDMVVFSHLHMPCAVQVSSMQMASPSPFWSPHALVCPRDQAEQNGSFMKPPAESSPWHDVPNQVFIADRYRVYDAEQQEVFSGFAVSFASLHPAACS